MPLLIYHSGALGDFITTLPAIDVLRQRFPGESTYYLGRKAHGDLGIHYRRFDAVWDIDKAAYASLFAPQPSAGALNLLSRFDAAMLFARSDAPIVANAQRAGIAHVLHHPPFPTRRMHAADYHCANLDIGFASRGQPAVPRLQARPQPARFVPMAIIHPGSGSALKNWPRERFMAVADELRRQNLQVVWIQGPADNALSVKSGDRIEPSPPLAKLADMLAACSLYLGNDSGVSHLAAAAGCPVIALFGPSDPVVWAPRGPCVRIIAGQCPEKRHCHGLGSPPPCENRDCLMSIGVDEVAAAASGLIAQTTRAAR